ncbi:MAG: EI24 domain-containing protein [Nevskiaceae bacterium]|nr:MAG: EI24 domain-containing protein [Nevskiaceae bacterium]TBR72629.1 MAG: EI24 domain-containing protein [Nevskiaceae bacterium]
MNDILVALAVGGRALFTRRMLGLVLWPLIGACAAWGLAAGLFWGDWVGLAQRLVESPQLAGFVGSGVLAFVGSALAWLLVLPLYLLAVLATALAVTAIFGMPAMVRDIAQRYYPQLERARGGTAAGSVGNVALTLIAYLLLMLVSLPFWFIVPFGGVALPLLINGWLNARLFRYDALAEHASPAEYRVLKRQARAGLFALGCAVAALQVLMSYTLVLLPVVLLFLPVYSGLVFVYYSLGRLQRLRAAPTSA